MKLYGPGIILRRIDYKGRIYSGELFPMRSPQSGPGWYLFARANDGQSSATIIHLTARPDVSARVHPHYNIRVCRGWSTLREARSVADLINGKGST